MKKMFFTAIMLLLVGSTLYSVAESPLRSEVKSPLQAAADPLVCPVVGLASLHEDIAAFDTIQIIDPSCKADCFEDRQACNLSGAPRWVCTTLYNECIAAC